MQPKKSGKAEVVSLPKDSFAILENSQTACYKHLCEKLMKSIKDTLGEKEAKRFEKLGSDINYTPTGVSGLV